MKGSKLMNIRRYIGNKNFYKSMLGIAMPIMIQNAITNSASLVDNVMIGQLGTEQISGVAIANQLMFVFNLTVFGSVTGASIFGSQFYGRKDNNGLRYTFRYKFISAFLLGLLGLILFATASPRLISLFLHDGGEGNLELALAYGVEYLKFLLPSLIPFAITQVYSSSLRETGNPGLPMKASIVAVIVNMVFNYILIFGHLGMPALGVQGAAIATVLSRFVEFFIVLIWTHKHVEINQYIIGVYRSFKIPAELAKQFFRKSLPLLLNEFFWSAGLALITQCYSQFGLIVVAGYNINSTVMNLFNIVARSLSSAIGIIIGTLLGAGKRNEAIDSNRKMLVFTVVLCSTLAIGLAALSGVIPSFYNTTQEAKNFASVFLIISAAVTPLQAYSCGVYYTLRSGGSVLITVLFDSCFVCLITLPIAFVLCNFSSLGIITIVAICEGSNILKCLMGYFAVKRGTWAKNLVEKYG